MEIALIPQPKSIRAGKGGWKLPPSVSIGITDRRLAEAAHTAGRFFKKHSIAAAGKNIADDISMLLNNSLPPGGYLLRIGKKGISIEAVSEEAAFHGVQTLSQIAAQMPSNEWPALTIRDYPDFIDRGVYYDLTRGRVPVLERLKEQADLLSRYKINHLELYLEHTFQFRRHPDIGKGASPLSAEDILSLDAFCAERHIELVPSLASFGHLASVLKHKQYHHLAEDWGVGKYKDPQAHKHRCIPAWSLSPANPKIYDFLDELFSELLPLFRSKRFNVCCDETWDLGLGQSYELCKRKGKGRVYLDHILKLNGLCKKYGKHMLFWGDIIRKYPELIPEVPTDVTVLDWNYDYDHNFDSIEDFKKAGLNFIACPGTSSWVSLFPRLPEAEANIHGFAEAALKQGAAGVLNTDWGDGGHYNFMEYSWHGYLFGAEQAWNVKADRSSFTRRFCTLFLGNGCSDLAAAVDRLGEVSQTHIDGYYQSVWEHLFFAPADDAIFEEREYPAVLFENGRIVRRSLKLNPAFAKKELKKLESVRRVFTAALKKKGSDPHGVLPYWIFAADTIIHAARKLSVIGTKGADGAAARKELKKEMTALRDRFKDLWTARNRKSEIQITLKRYKKAINSL